MYVDYSEYKFFRGFVILFLGIYFGDFYKYVLGDVYRNFYGVVVCNSLKSEVVVMSVIIMSIIMMTVIIMMWMNRLRNILKIII